MPLAVNPLWLLLRLKTPREGMLSPTIRATPGATAMLWTCASALVSMAIACGIDIYLFGSPLNAPLAPYHALLFAPPFIILLVGVYWSERVAKRQRAKDLSREYGGGTG